ncbi:ABC transporter permease [Gynurincola endophyticus]|uniref:ABC transporter permease n=1 Tax=Gynurincola endophyticus TaxID=2479004 RepID=UPI000F8D342F|nr:ABC transporter permease [Gynurincola endophyticus]
MFKNYLKIAFRNLWKTKGYSLLNIVGLSIGMASAILIFLWIQNELSIERFHEKGNRIFVMYNKDKSTSGEIWAWNSTPQVMGPTLKTDYPEVEDMSRFTNSTFLVKLGDKKINGQAAFVDSGFLKIFSFPLMQGNKEIALNNTYDIVLTEKFAKSMFGNEDPMGKSLILDSVHNFIVTGVLKDLPNNTIFRFDYLLPFSYQKVIGNMSESWTNNSLRTYVLLKDPSLHSTFDSKVRTITIDHTKESANPSTIEVFSHPLEKLYLYGKNDNGKLVAGNLVMVRLFSVIGAFILLIACINFMNLSTARSEKRAKEVGIRKVVGVTKTSLVLQFLGESILLSIISFILALLLVTIVLSGFNTLVGKELFIPFKTINFWLYSIAFILLTGLIAGSYPSFYLSSFNPVKVLKGTYKKVKAPFTPRKVLVTIQFTFAIILITSTIIISKQIRFGLEREAGYDRKDLVYIFNEGDVKKHFSAIKNDLISRGAILSATMNQSPITQRWSDSWGFKWSGSTKEDEKELFLRLGTDADFVKTMGLELIQGRDIDVYQYPSDSSALILNESAVKAMRLEDPIGQKVGFVGGDAQMTIVGVIKDFIIESPFQEKITPMMIAGPIYYWPNVAHFKLNPANNNIENLKILKEVLAKYNPEYPANYVFADENYATKFKGIERTGKLVVLFAGLTIFISCLGLFGLATYMAENRVKEIGIRKVLGASVFEVTSLLSREFLTLVLISFVIATPIAWYIMHQWLADYSYKISIEWWIFALVALIAILITLFTVSFQSIKAAIANPVKSLRDE